MTKSKFRTATVRFEIQNIHVKKTYRRQGIGRILFKETIPLKYAQGIRKFSLGVNLDNETARAFYEALGFEDRPQDHIRYVLAGDKLGAFMDRKQ